MQVWHGFAAVRAVVDDETVAGFIEAKMGGDFGGFEQEMTEEFLVTRLRLGDARNRFLRDDDDVHGGLRIDVAEGENGVVFKNDGGGNFAPGDFFKQGFAHNQSLDTNCTN